MLYNIFNISKMLNYNFDISLFKNLLDIKTINSII